MLHKYMQAGKGDEDQTAQFRRLMLANANRGGENVATGALMGALVGAHIGFSQLPKDLVAGLAPSQRPQLDNEIEAFVRSSPFVAAQDSTQGSL